jgi:eukaryotic-like serine/threonine-protein kinase
MVPGTHVAPSIRLTRQLGEGGMGSVWLADHLALKTQVVVKFMGHALAQDPGSRERFSREAVAASQVKSPHVVQTFDHGVTSEGVPFIVMELLEGEDLSHRIKRGPLAPSHVASMLIQVCRALARAHAIGVVHRDIKPENIFMCEVGGDEPFVKLLDFGVAKTAHNPTLDSKTRTGAMLGTPYYMSPEQFAGTRDVDLRVDLWALGVVTYECLTGVRPFEASTIGGLAIAVHSGELPLPSLLRPELPPEVDAWFRRACARPVAERFQSARELAESFTVAISTGRGIAQKTPGAPVQVSSALASTESWRGPNADPLLVSTGGAASLASAAKSQAAASLAAPLVKSKRLALGLGATALVLVAIGSIALSRSSSPSSAAPSAPLASPGVVSPARPPTAILVPETTQVLPVEATPSIGPTPSRPTASASAPATHVAGPATIVAPSKRAPAPTSSASSDPFGSHIF